MRIPRLGPWPLLLVASALAPASARAVTPDAALRAAIAARVGVPEADVSVSDLDPPADLPRDAEFEVDLPSYAIREGHVSVTLRTRDGSWRLYPEVNLWVMAPVAVAAVERGQPVELRVDRVRLRDLRGATPVDPAQAWEATASFQAGQPVTSGRVRRLPDRRQGSSVEVIVVRGALSVRAPGQLLSDGVVGDAVPVLNLATRAQQFGTLQADGTVLLGGS